MALEPRAMDYKWILKEGGRSLEVALTCMSVCVSVSVTHTVSVPVFVCVSVCLCLWDLRAMATVSIDSQRLRRFLLPSCRQNRIATQRQDEQLQIGIV